MTPPITGRKYWNYVKTNDVRLLIPNCPKEHLNTMKALFDNGVTVWHLENGEMFSNVDYDNVEV